MLWTAKKISDVGGLSYQIFLSGDSGNLRSKVYKSKTLSHWRHNPKGDCEILAHSYFPLFCGLWSFVPPTCSNSERLPHHGTKATDQSQIETSIISHNKYSLSMSCLSQALHFSNGKITDTKARKIFLTVGSKEQAEKDWWNHHWLLKPGGQKLDESCVLIYVQNIWQKVVLIKRGSFKVEALGKYSYPSH